jgi:ribosomal protein S18 acetylase RimI-like enzyme
VTTDQKPAIDPVEGLNMALAALLTSVAGVPGSEAVVAPDVIFGTLGIPIPPLNNVIGARFAAETADGRIDGVLRWFAERQMPLLWWVGPDDEPGDLGRRLIDHGLILDDDERIPGMVAPLDDLRLETPPPGVTVERVIDEATFRSACAVVAEGFGAPPEFGEALAKMGVIGFADDVQLRTYLARLEGRPAATALGVRSGEVLGIFNVATLPDVRGRGLGRAVTLAAMRDGVAEGCRVAVLQSSEMGHPVYERLGFTDFCEFELYVRNVGE